MIGGRGLIAGTPRMKVYTDKDFKVMASLDTDKYAPPGPFKVFGKLQVYFI